MGAYVVTASADRDLDSIWMYMATESGHVAADRLENQLHEVMCRLADAPGMGHSRQDVDQPDILFFRLHSYMIAYKRSTSPLEILRVLHGARDFSEIFRTDAS